MRTTIVTGVREKSLQLDHGPFGKILKAQVTTWNIVWKRLGYTKITAR